MCGVTCYGSQYRLRGKTEIGAAASCLQMFLVLRAEQQRSLDEVYTTMDASKAPSSAPIEGSLGGLLSDEDVLTGLVRGQAVQKDVQDALAR